MKLLVTIALSASLFTASAQTKYDVITVNQREILVDNYEIEKNKIINSQNGFSRDYKVVADNGSNFDKAEPEISYDVDLIRETLQNYIGGSSYNETDLIESAFTTDATLYLTVRGEFQRLSPKEYTSFFQSKESGVFNGRHGKILDIFMERDIAMAKVEIVIPSRKMRFIDLFLLKEFDHDWKIISKTATLMNPNLKK